MADLLPGRPMDPRSQHAYLYAHGNPLANFDPTGLVTAIGVLTAAPVMQQQ